MDTVEYRGGSRSRTRTEEATRTLGKCSSGSSSFYSNRHHMRSSPTTSQTIMGTILKTNYLGILLRILLAPMCDERLDPGCHLSYNKVSILVLHNSHGALTENRCEK